MFDAIKNWLLQPVRNQVGATDFSALASDAVTYIAEKTLSIAYKIVRFYEAADKAKLPSQSSKTFQYTRYERLSLPQSTLTDGVTPSDTSMSITTVTAVAEQWGAVVTITDVAELTIRHKPLQKAIQLLGIQAAETIDRVIFNVLMGGTTVFYPGATAGRLNIGATDYVTASVLARIVAQLRALGAMGIEKPKAGSAEDPELGDDYLAIVDPFVEQDVAADSDFKSAHQYASAKTLWNGEAGSYKGFRFVRSNLIPMLTSAAAASTADNSADNGTLAANKGLRVMVTGVDNLRGYERVIYQSSEQATANDGNQAHTVTVTIPATAGYTYNIYASDGTAAAGATTTATAMTLQGSGYAPSASIKLGSSAGTASSTRLQLTTTGAAAPAQLAASTRQIHLSFFIGKEAYTCVDLMALQSTLTAPVATDSDPLIQRRKAGWKTMFKAVINNNNFFARCESSSAFDAGAAAFSIT